MKRLVAYALLAGMALAAGPVAAADTAQPVTGSKDITVASVKTYQTSVGTADLGQPVYFVCRLTFKNDLGYDTTPEPKNFILTDSLGTQYVGFDSGDVALVGISNYGGVVKQDATQDYTIAFRVPANTTGAVFYSPF